MFREGCMERLGALRGWAPTCSRVSEEGPVVCSTCTAKSSENAPPLSPPLSPTVRGIPHPSSQEFIVTPFTTWPGPSWAVVVLGLLVPG